MGVVGNYPSALRNKGFRKECLLDVQNKKKTKIINIPFRNQISGERFSGKDVSLMCKTSKKTKITNGTFCNSINRITRF
jgi:hypothetical protein